MKKGKVLFFYPNSEGYGGIPNGIALLSGCLKKAGFKTKCFDTTFLKSAPLDHGGRQKTGGVEKLDVDISAVWGKWNPEIAEKIPGLFIETIKKFNPDLIAVSLIEVNYNYGISLLNNVKKHFNIPIIAGGIFTTLDPESVISNNCIDAILVGEGEEALTEFANCVINKKDYGNIKNIWIKKNGEITKNPLRPLEDLDTIPFQDWSIFDERHFYKPYCGKIYKAAFIELARGCPFNCAYCCTASLKKIYSRLGNFLRERNVDIALDEICRLKKKYGIEFILFTDDNFLGMSKNRLTYFCEQYKERVNLPFYIQTRVETIKEDYMSKLKNMAIDPKICTFGIGIEHGSEFYRKKFMNRKMSNESIKKAFKMVHEFEFRTTANIMIGMPCENEDIAKESIKLLKEIKPKTITVSYFQPFRGTDMRELSVEKGFISKNHIVNGFTKPIETMPQFKPEIIKHYYENYQKYVDGDL